MLFMVALSPNTVTAAIQAGAFLIAGSSILIHYHDARKQIRLDDDTAPPTKEEVDAVRLSEELDGTPIGKESFEQRIRIVRSLLVLLAALALSLSAAEVAFATADGNRSRMAVLASEVTWPLLSGSLLWVGLAATGTTSVLHSLD
jgi:hypothetical protein